MLNLPPHLFASRRRETIAALRREHIFVKVLLGAAALMFLYCLIVLSYALLGDAHPIANDFLARSAAYHTFSCHEKPLDGVKWYFAKYSAFTGFYGVGAPSFMPLYLLFVYILLRRTGYGEIDGKGLLRVYFVFFAILSASVPGFLLFLQLAAEIFPSLGGTFLASPAGMVYARTPAWGAEEEILNFFLSSPGNFRENCGVLFGDIVVFSIPCIINIWLSAAVIKRFYSGRKLAYQCVYYSLAMGWYIFPGADYHLISLIKYFPFLRALGL